MEPRLRTVDKAKPPYALNKFPSNFSFLLAKHITYLMATRQPPSIEGEEWESIFAQCIGADWKPSNVGLDDVVLGSFGWSAKTVKHKHPDRVKRVRLISGRNSPTYSYGTLNIRNTEPSTIGNQVLTIWNERVSAVRANYKQLRTVVLIKSHKLTELVIFEFETIRYDSDQYLWSWNKNGNLIGVNKRNQKHTFTWQPHGSQFTIVEDVPGEKLFLRLNEPEPLKMDVVLKEVGFDYTWVEKVRD